MKKIFVCLILFSLIFTLASCANEEYRNDVKVSFLTEEIESALPLQPYGYSSHGGDYLLYRFVGIDKHIDGYSIIYSKNTSLVDLIAIFHAKSNSDTDEAEEICEDFIEDQKALFSSLVDQYKPEEKPKLEKAEVRTFGQYIVVCILDKDARAKAFSIIEAELSKQKIAT